MLKILESLYVKGSSAYDKTEARKIWKVRFVFLANPSNLICTFVL